MRPIVKNYDFLVNLFATYINLSYLSERGAKILDKDIVSSGSSALRRRSISLSFPHISILKQSVGKMIRGRN